MKLNEIYDSVVAEGSSAFAEVIAILEQAGARYVMIGGLAVNSYVEPVFTADADIVIALNEIEENQRPEFRCRLLTRPERLG